jgi:methionyl-tRNA synthetase
MVGKDILRFHAVYWPAFLMSAGLPLPKKIFAHGWWTIEGEKMSKSLGNVVAPAELVEAYGLDATRWFLMREVPFGNDGNFSREGLVNRANAELSNTIGNLVQRTLSMIQKHCGGQVPQPLAALRPIDREFLEKFLITDEKTPQAAREQYAGCRFHEALGSLVEMAAAANEYIDKQAPWTLKKHDPEMMQAVLYYLAEGIRCLGIFLQPAMPSSASAMLDQLAVPKDRRLFEHAYNFEFPATGKLKEHSLKPGTPLPPPSPVFPRLEQKVTAEEGAA